MIRCSLNLSKITPLNRLQIERMVRLAGRYSSRVLYEHNNRVINGKSMLGLLSMGVTGMDEVILTVEGEDEEAAAEALRLALEEGVAPPKDMSDADKIVQYIKEKYPEITDQDEIQKKMLQISRSLEYGGTCQVYVTDASGENQKLVFEGENMKLLAKRICGDYLLAHVRYADPNKDFEITVPFTQSYGFTL